MPQSISAYEHTLVHDLLDRPPGWLLRSGIGMLFLFAVTALGIAAFIRYPERLEAPCVLQTEVPPLPLRLGTAAFVDILYIGDAQMVHAGQRLAAIRFAGSHTDVDTLAAWVTTAREAARGDEFPPLPTVPLEVGPLQGAYNQVIATYTAHAEYNAHNGVRETMKRQRREIGSTQKLAAGMRREQLDYRESLSLSRARVRRDSLLEIEGLVSRQELEQSRQTAVGTRRQRQGVLSATVQHEVRINQLKREMAELERQHLLELNRLTGEARRALFQLDAELNALLPQLYLTSPRTGRLSWRDGIGTHTLFDPTVPLGYVLPAGSSETILVRGTLPAAAAGKAEIGQRLFVALDGYPEREYGQLTGRITHLAPLAEPNSEGAYGIAIRGELEGGLRTTYRRDLPFTQNTPGTLRVVTAERSLLSRLFTPIVDLFKTH